MLHQICHGCSVMRLVQCCSFRLVKQPTTVEEFEAFAKKYLMKDIYGFYSSGSIIGLQQTLQENTVAFSRYIESRVYKGSLYVSFRLLN